jgi:hypothetical protein
MKESILATRGGSQLLTMKTSNQIFHLDILDNFLSKPAIEAKAIKVNFS